MQVPPARRQGSVHRPRAHRVQRSVRRCGSRRVSAAERVQQLTARRSGITGILLQHVRHGITQRIQLRLSLIQLFFAFLQLHGAGAERISALFVFRFAVGIVCKTLLILRLCFLIFGKAILVLLLAVLQGLIGIIQLRTGVGQLLPPIPAQE